MYKFHGMIGFAETDETKPGIWEETFVEKEYYGEVIKNTRRIQNGVGINDNIVISNQLSILTNEYLIKGLGRIRYVVWYGEKWKVDSVDPGYPRSTLTIGGLFNG